MNSNERPLILYLQSTCVRYSKQSKPAHTHWLKVNGTCSHWREKRMIEEDSYNLRKGRRRRRLRACSMRRVEAVVRHRWQGNSGIAGGRRGEGDTGRRWCASRIVARSVVHNRGRCAASINGRSKTGIRTSDKYTWGAKRININMCYRCANGKGFDMDMWRRGVRMNVPVLDNTWRALRDLTRALQFCLLSFVLVLEFSHFILLPALKFGFGGARGRLLLEKEGHETDAKRATPAAKSPEQ